MPAVSCWWFCGCDITPVPIIVLVVCRLLAKGVTVVIWGLRGLTVLEKKGGEVGMTYRIGALPFGSGGMVMWVMVGVVWF